MSTNPMNERLATMLTYRRPHDSAGEEAFVKRFITDPYPQYQVLGPMDNIVIEVGEGSRTLFSCHTDTVHRNDEMQKIYWDVHREEFFKKDEQPLGADDAAGVWLMLEMIDAGIPGTYVFHRGEERGGIGSTWVSTNAKDWLKDNFDRAIAFDRKATHSVITHQGYGRCCSDLFGEALAEALNAACDDFMYVTDDTGVFTDTANYTDYISECTNISCGYYNEHTARETLSAGHLMQLRNACLLVDWETLPIKREPGDDDLDYSLWSGYSSWNRYSSYTGPKTVAGTPKDTCDDPLSISDLMDMKYPDLVAFIKKNPEWVADLIYDEMDSITTPVDYADEDDEPAFNYIRSL
jgi:hypothetical protein